MSRPRNPNYFCTTCAKAERPRPFRECKACQRFYDRRRYADPKRVARRNLRVKLDRIKNPEKYREWQRANYRRNKDKILAACRRWKENFKKDNREKYLEQKRNEYLRRKEKHLTYQKEWAARNKMHLNAWKRKNYAANLERHRGYIRNYYLKQKRDPSLWERKRDRDYRHRHGDYAELAKLIYKLKTKVREYGKQNYNGRRTTDKN